MGKESVWPALLTGPHQRVESAEGTDVDMSPGKRLSTGEGAGRRSWPWIANEDMDGKVMKARRMQKIGRRRKSSEDVEGG